MKTNLAQLFSILINLDQAKSYVQISKLIVELGETFPGIHDSRIMNDISYLQNYLIVDSDSNRVEVKVEDMILYLSDRYIKNNSSDFSLLFTVGYNTIIELDSDKTTFSFASEKNGIGYKLIDFYARDVFNSTKKKSTIKNVPLRKKQNPFLKAIYLNVYASGLLYQIEALKTEDSLNGATYGIGTGIRFFNDL